MRSSLLMAATLVAGCSDRGVDSTRPELVDSLTGETGDTKGETGGGDDTTDTADTSAEEPVIDTWTLTCEGEASYWLDLDLGVVPGEWPPDVVVWAQYAPAYKDLTWQLDAEVHMQPPASWRVVGTWAASDDGHIKLPCRWIAYDHRQQYWSFEVAEYKVLLRH